MLFHTFRSGPPKLLQSEYTSWCCFQRPSRGPLQNRRQYHTFDIFCFGGSRELILLSLDLHLGSLWCFLKLPCPPLFALDPPFRSRVSAVRDVASQGPPWDHFKTSKKPDVFHIFRSGPQIRNYKSVSPIKSGITNLYFVSNKELQICNSYQNRNYISVIPITTVFGNTNL